MNNLSNIDTAQQVNDLSNTVRYELKYTIDESIASDIKDYIQNICTLDKNVPEGESGYTVNNLYFDTSDLRFYNDTKFRKPIRFKPRARYYGNKATDFIWPEIKYRNASVIWKRRYKIPIERWPELFYTTEKKQSLSVINTHLDTFDDIIYWFSAQPVLHVRYFREPYVSDLEAYGRVTFDRRLTCRPTHGSIDLDYDERDMLFYDDPISSQNYDSQVLLEIKVEKHVPYWAIELIRKFNLMQRPYSKYCYGIDSIMNYNHCGRTSKFY
ncbi:MAG: hypothetical protein CVV23_11235 [Ignavibacteriae bacterium HGW-Ignavibacteriae-2]|jgi:hypothetical protein|nr:MAG: hypothetical protein CVV23_11235 [Ignavibacteriae bacterium HGW-Ignavibacteriae-2]